MNPAIVHMSSSVATHSCTVGNSIQQQTERWIMEFASQEPLFVKMNKQFRGVQILNFINRKRLIAPEEHPVCSKYEFEFNLAP
jgi:hypothetical protein